MNASRIDLLLKGWDELDNAIQRVGTAMPFQLSTARSKLDAERRDFRRLIQDAAREELVELASADEAAT